MTDRDWNWNWNDNWDWLRSSKSGDDSQTDCESSESHEQTQAKTDESTHSQTIHRRALLQTGLTALVVGGSIGSVSDRATAQKQHPHAGTQSGDFSPRQQAVSPPEQFTAPLWSTQFNTRVRLVRTQAEDGALYLTQPVTGDSSAQLRSFDLQSGRERWSRDLSPSVDARRFAPLPRVLGSTILVGEGPTVANYEASSGTRRWQTQYPGEGANNISFSSPIDNIIILASGENVTQNQLVGIDRQTGEIQWRNTIDLPGEQIRVTLPLFTSGSTGLQPVLFITAQGHRILRLDASTGDVIEQYTAQIAAQFSDQGFTPSSAFVEEEENFVTITSFGRGVEVVRAFDSLEAVENDPVSVISGDIGGIQELSNVTGTPETKAYVVQTEGRLRAVALPTTETLWETSISSDVTEEIRLETANRIYTTRFTPNSERGSDGELEVVARSNSTGEEQWARTVFGDNRLLIEELGENQLAVQQTNGVVVSLDKGTGEVGQWAVSLPAASDEENSSTNFNFKVNNDSNVVIGTASSFESEETTVSVFSTPSGDDSGSGSLEELSVSLSRSSVPAGGQSELTVEVTETATEEAVSGATVSVSELGVSVTTDNTGTATLSLADATPGEYTLSVSVEGYITASETVTVTDIEPQSPVDEYDTNNDGEISIGEISTAAADFIDGDLSIGDISQIAAEFIN